MREVVEMGIGKVESKNKNLGGDKEKMKTKNKVLALLEIAVVLCSVFLVATLPAVAAGQNQTTQKVSTTASEDDFVLNIYGNANEDDTIDMRDVTYTKLVIFGKKPETELADAYYDGEVDVLDVVQVKLIILGRESELTFLDFAERIVTVSMPVERVITLGGYDAEVIRLLGAMDKIVGISGWMPETFEVYFPELAELPTVGAWDWDYEAMLELNPNLVTVWQYSVAEIDEHLPDSIAVADFEFYYQEQEIFNEEVMKLGYILDKRDEAKYFLDNFYDKHIDPIKAQTEGLSEGERPKVYFEWADVPYYTFAGANPTTQEIYIAGGKNIFADLDISITEVDREEVVMRDPDIIITFPSTLGPAVGYGVDDPSHAEAARDEILNRPELAGVSAVKNGDVYVMDMGILNGPEYPIGLAYWAKWCQPELFEDLDPNPIHREYLTEFWGLDYDLDKHGIFVYHPKEHPDGK